MEIRKIVRSKLGILEAAPDFNFEERKVTFHPIPDELLSIVKEGEEWEGDFGVMHTSGKVDKKGNTIFVEYFLPKSKKESSLHW